MGALTEWNTLADRTPPNRKQGSPLLYFLTFIFVLFIGILVFCYAVTKRADPVFLDAHGNPTTQSSGASHH